MKGLAGIGLDDQAVFGPGPEQGLRGDPELGPSIHGDDLRGGNQAGGPVDQPDPGILEAARQDDPELAADGHAAIQVGLAAVGQFQPNRQRLRNLRSFWRSWSCGSSAIGRGHGSRGCRFEGQDRGPQKPTDWAGSSHGRNLGSRKPKGQWEMHRLSPIIYVMLNLSR